MFKRFEIAKIYNSKKEKTNWGSRKSFHKIFYLVVSDDYASSEEPALIGIILLAENLPKKREKLLLWEKLCKIKKIDSGSQ